MDTIDTTAAANPVEIDGIPTETHPGSAAYVWTADELAEIRRLVAKTRGQFAAAPASMTITFDLVEAIRPAPALPTFAYLRGTRTVGTKTVRWFISIEHTGFRGHAPGTRPIDNIYSWGPEYQTKGGTY